MDPEMASEGDIDDPFEACVHCGAPFEPGTRYPVETRITSDGDTRLYSCCSEDCRREWIAEPDS